MAPRRSLAGHAAAASAALVLLASSALSSAYSPLSDHSFAPPFTTFDRDGMREIPFWTLGGNGVDFNENFVRLTPDRAGRKGYVWNKVNIGNKDEWSVTIRFRVSGQGKRMFGDGLAFFATNHATYREGNLHGFADTFKGFGVIFDTFVNTEPGHVHKDILLVSNDGSGSKAAPHGGSNDPNPAGCDGDLSEFRYWEGRDDFSVMNHSVAKIVFRENRVSVYIDARNTGQMSPCVLDVPVNAPEGWHREGAYIGVIATTGDLADNHDVLSIHASLDSDTPPNPFDRSGNDHPITTGNPIVDEAVNRMIERSSVSVNERLTYIHHSMEHQLAAVHDGIKATLKKLGEAEESNKRRIEEIERKLQAKVADTIEGSITERLAKLEQQVDSKVASSVDGNMAQRLAQLESRMSSVVDSSVTQRLAKLEQQVDNKVASSIDGSLAARLGKLEQQVDSRMRDEYLPRMEASLNSSSRSWLIPFLVILAIVLAGFGYGYGKIRHILKVQGIDFGLGYSPTKKY